MALYVWFRGALASFSKGVLSLSHLNGFETIKTRKPFINISKRKKGKEGRKKISTWSRAEETDEKSTHGPQSSSSYLPSSSTTRTAREKKRGRKIDGCRGGRGERTRGELCRLYIALVLLGFFLRLRLFF